MATSTNNDPLLTVRQLADREGLTERQVRYAIKQAGLPCVAAFGGKRVRLSEYLAWLEARRVRQAS